MGSPIVRNSTLRSHHESVQRVITAMRSQLDQPLSLQAMARIAFASPYHFVRTFRQVTGVPPSQFLYALRLERARRLLLQTQRKVIDICYDVGYNSVGTFTRRFTDLLGVSPTAFRRMARSRARRRSERADLSSLETRSARSGHIVSGHVGAPAHFHGLIFVGLFETAIPQAMPLACAMPVEGGFYQIEGVPEGEFYLFALGLRYPIQAPASLHYETAMRAGGHAVKISRNFVRGSTDLSLRPPSPFDPPILLVLPLLMQKFFSDRHEYPASFAHATQTKEQLTT
jgi:AraC family transcriptional regulator